MRFASSNAHQVRAMTLKYLPRALQCLASLGWASAGVAKTLFPAPAVVGGVAVAVPLVIMVGLLEIGIAAAWWLPSVRKHAAFVGMVAASVFAISIIGGVVTPETCACFGSLQVSKSRHLMALGLLIVISALHILSSNEDSHVGNVH
jgi:hypothetical protein